MARYRKQEEIPTVDELEEETKEEEGSAPTPQEVKSITRKVNKNPITSLTNTILAGMAANASSNAPITSLPLTGLGTPQTATIALPTHTLESAADTEEAIKEMFSNIGNLPSPLARHEILAKVMAMPNVQLSTKALEKTKGGTKTGEGTERYRKNVAWAIQRMLKSNMLSRVGRNLYLPTMNMPTMPQSITNPQTAGATPGIVPPTPQKPAEEEVAVVQAPEEKAEEEPAEEEPKAMEAIVPIEPAAVEPAKTEVIEVKGNELPQVTNPELEGTREYWLKTLQAPAPSRKFYPDKDIQTILNSKLKSKNTPMEIFLGPARVAKTTGVEAWAYANQLPYVKVQCGRGTTESELIGHEVLVSNGTSSKSEFEAGDLPRAIEAANAVGNAVLLFDELNALQPAYMKYLNSLTGHNKEVRGSGGRVWRLKPGANLIIFATMNPSNYAATNRLNKELLGRSAVFHVNYPTLAIERKILKDTYNDPDLIDKLILLASFTRESQGQDPDFYAISPRDEDYLLQSYKDLMESGVDAKKALELSLIRFVLNKYTEDPDDRDKAEAMKNKINDIFGIDMKLPG